MGMPSLPFCGLEIRSLLPHLRVIPTPKTLAEHIRKRRLQRQLLQSDIAKQFNASEDTITGWENRRSFLQIRYYPKLIEFYGYNPSETDTETLGGRIKEYRIQNGLSYRKLGQMIGVDASTIAAWEDNEHTPTRKKLTIIERIITKELST